MPNSYQCELPILSFLTAITIIKRCVVGRSISEDGYFKKLLCNYY